jgi:hypothetical protein
MADTWKMLWRAAGEMGLCGSNGDGERRDAGRFLLRQLHDSRSSEYDPA